MYKPNLWQFVIQYNIHKKNIKSVIKFPPYLNVYVYELTSKLYLVHVYQYLTCQHWDIPSWTTNSFHFIPNTSSIIGIFTTLCLGHPFGCSLHTLLLVSKEYLPMLTIGLVRSSRETGPEGGLALPTNAAAFPYRLSWNHSHPVDPSIVGIFFYMNRCK